MYPELYKCNLRESTFVEFCVDAINLFVENNFIDSLGLGRDSNPDPSALKPSECTTTPSTFKAFIQKRSIKFSNLVCALTFETDFNHCSLNCSFSGFCDHVLVSWSEVSLVISVCKFQGILIRSFRNIFMDCTPQ
jgi:hypothetical protein